MTQFDPARAFDLIPAKEINVLIQNSVYFSSTFALNSIDCVATNGY